MSLLFESIRCFNGKFENLDLHIARMKRSILALFSIQIDFTLDIIAPYEGLYKCRVVYDTEIRSVEFIPYEPNNIKSLKIIEANGFSYQFKFLDRQVLNDLFKLKDNCDDILIVIDGHITDTSYGNIVFFDGKTWVTPEKPLLRGIYREKLLNEGLVEEHKIKVSDLNKFSKFAVINALRRFDFQSDLKLYSKYSLSEIESSELRVV